MHVFPARAGMSLGVGKPRLPNRSVPRASGDEPGYAWISYISWSCSPRERG